MVSRCRTTKLYLTTSNIERKPYGFPAQRRVLVESRPRHAAMLRGVCTARPPLEQRSLHLRRQCGPFH